MIRQRVLICITLGFVIHAKLQPHDRTGQSAFVPRCLVTDSVYDQFLNNYRSTVHANNKPNDRSKKRYHVPTIYEQFINNIRFMFYGKEKPPALVHSKKPSRIFMQPLYAASGQSKSLASYFLLNGKDAIRFKEGGGADSDVASDHFGLIGAQVLQGSNSPSRGEFDSKVSLRPKRSLYAVILGVHGNLDRVLTGLFFQVSVPIVHVRHELKIKEFDKKALSSSSPNTILQALTRDDWNYGKFDPHRMQKDGIDDVLFKLGYAYKNKSRFYGAVYGDIIAPLGDGPTAKYVFEPIIGSVHPGLGLGSCVDWFFYEKKSSKVSIIGDVRYHYRFGAKELRSLDLKANGPWSRYLRLVRRGGVRPLDGINFLTRAVDVLPRGAFQLFGSLHYQHKEVHIEGGYNLYARAREAVEFHDSWDQQGEDIGIYSKTSYTNKTASRLTINDAPTDRTKVDSTFIRIKEEDFDLREAGHKSALSHKVFGGASIDCSFFDSLGRAGVAASYEFGQENTTLSQWSFWFNVTVQF